MTTSDPLPSAPASAANDLFRQAVSHHQAGRIDEAEGLYRTVLQIHPTLADANHNMGVLMVHRGRPDAALPFFKSALSTSPEQAHHWLGYVETLIQAGQVDVARQILVLGRQHGLQGEAVDVLALKLGVVVSSEGRPGLIQPADDQTSANPHTLPDKRQSSTVPVKRGKSVQETAARKMGKRAPGTQDINMLMALYGEGKFAEAVTVARSFTARFPNDGFGWKVLGHVLGLLGENADALTSLKKASELLPQDCEVHNVLGNVLLNLKNFSAAETSYRRALKIKPAFADAHNNLGVILRVLGRYEDAITSCRRAIEVNPAYAEAHANLGNALRDLGKTELATASYLRSLEINPRLAEAHNGLGVILREQGQFDKAEESCLLALNIRPDYLEAHNNLAGVLQDQCRFDNAIANYRRALAINPDFVDAHSNLLFCLNYHPELPADEIFGEYQRWNQKFARPAQHHTTHANSRESARRLRIGYVSPDMRQHSARHFIEPLLARHDKTRFEVFAYAQVRVEDSVSATFKGYCDQWINTAGLSNLELAERIVKDRIDILVDLAGHTSGNRLLAFARKPAPVQVSWLGYGYTTGLDAIDYLLADHAFAPPGSESLFAEKLVRLPCWVAYRPAQGMGEVSALPAMQTGTIRFGALSRSIRLNTRVIRRWAAILQRVPGSRLVLDSADLRSVGMQQQLRDRFAEYGIDADRLDLGFHSPPWNVLGKIDIGLDCFPHNSGTTLFENLYLGVPFITLAGRPSVGRIGATILNAAGHPEWIAATEEEYVEKAVSLASDINELARIRASLRSQMESSVLMDEAGLARSVESAYLTMWQRWCGDVPASEISFPAPGAL